VAPGPFARGVRVVLPNLRELGYVTVDMAQPDGDGGWLMYVKDDSGTLHRADINSEQAKHAELLIQDGAAPSRRVVAGMWTQWMAAAASNARSTLLASAPLNPYAHQANAVYGAMLPQPWLRFLLADEPGTGKTIMAGLYPSMSGSPHSTETTKSAGKRLLTQPDVSAPRSYK
jgi:hypothetical protein